MARKGPRPGRAAPKASISLMLPVELLDQINNQANSLGISRAKWFELVARDVLDSKPVNGRRELVWG